MSSPSYRRARIAVAALFLSNGALFANLLPRYPEIKAALALSNTEFGLSVAAFSAGALVSGLTAGALIRRASSARVAVIASVALAAFTFIAGVSSAPAGFALALAAAGASDAVTDVAQNAHGLRVQRGYGRSIINSLHAVWSVGAVLGGLMGAAAIALQISRGVQLGVSAVVFSALVLGGYRMLLRGPDEPAPAADQPQQTDVDPRATRTGVYRVLLVLALLAIAGAAVEDAGSSWATIYLRDNIGAPAAIAAFGYVALVAFQFLGRATGDRLVDRFGERAVVRTGGLIAGVGMGAALAFPSTPGTIAGFAMAGLGVATVIPGAFHGADRTPGLRPGSGLTMVTWLMRIGFLASPAVVGAVADAIGLRLGLLVVPVAAVVIILCAGVLPTRVSGPGRTARS
ncbi:MAG TPA: MFS transporter [Mycobacterium sp.]|nr:MFS transporter [Mycobacterium sp.]